jgi:ribosomal protein S18 acetylase RimI-like enzyme
MLRVSLAHEVTDDLVSAVHRLLPQLSGSARLPSRADVEEIVTSQATTLLIVRDDGMLAEAEGDKPQGRADDAGGPYGPVVGMLTLATFRIPTGVRAWIEDVVVDTAARGRGAGEALTQAALELAGARGAQTVDLTSRPSREAANRLYQKVGFELRETNVYRAVPQSPGGADQANP